MTDFSSGYGTQIKTKIKAEAEALGFCFCGFTSVAPVEDFPRYQIWLEEGKHAGMTYLSRPDHLEARKGPLVLLPAAKSIIVVGTFYHSFSKNQPFSVASFAHYDDYHEQIPKRFELLIKKVERLCNVTAQYKIFVDSAPLLERSLAVRAGLGWIGRSSMFVNSKYGSQVLLSECLIDIKFEPDAPFTEDLCGNCQRCVDACPTKCINPESRSISSSKCIAYQTIENRSGQADNQILQLAGNSVFGCDRCIQACPWNKRTSQFATYLQLSNVVPELSDLDFDEIQFKEKFRASPILRTKLKHYKENLLNALQNNMVKNE